MATQVNCFNCIFFNSHGEEGKNGECRRFPPACMYDPEGETTIVAFPFIFDPLTTYCGECVVPEEIPNESGRDATAV